MCPTGMAVLFQSLVVWQPEQSPLAMAGSPLEA
jgi:hypothetical protein